MNENLTKCCVAATPVEPLNSIASDIIDTLAETRSVSYQISDRLFPANTDDAKIAQSVEPTTLEQKLTQIRILSREINIRLSNINGRI